MKRTLDGLHRCDRRVRPANAEPKETPEAKAGIFDDRAEEFVTYYVTKGLALIFAAKRDATLRLHSLLRIIPAR